MERIAKPLDQLKDRYDAVVIGSGYGGAPVVERIARSGRTVCLLERGREFHPGDFPRTFAQVLAQVGPDRLLSQGPGLFDFQSGPGGILAGCGLGGTSLINGGVQMEADPRVLDDPAWPTPLRGGTDPDWIAGLQRARDTLRPATVPDDAPRLPRLEAHAWTARQLGVPFRRAPASVAFVADRTIGGVDRGACVLCGDCCTGCNAGAKGTTANTWLASAASHGADIFTEADVIDIERSGDDWIVRFRPHASERKRFDAPPAFVRAGVVVLAAGTPGSPGILLRSRARGLPLSNCLGARVSANGATIAFAWDGERTIDGVGCNPGNPVDGRPVGPAATGIADARPGTGLEDGVVLFDAAIPGALGRLLGTTVGFAGMTRADDGAAGALARWAHRAADQGRSMLLGPHQGAAARTQTLVATGHDASPGRVVLDREHARIVWEDGRAPSPAVTDIVKRAAGTLGTTAVPGTDLPTLFPLGGCGMADRAENGVVDSAGRVFAGIAGTTVHDGLYVVDASVVPRSLGVPPSLTIAALAERTAATILRDRGWTEDADGAPVLPPDPPPRPGIAFTEKMAGAVAPVPPGDAPPDFVADGPDATPLAFVVTIETDDLYALLQRPDHHARLIGTVQAPGLCPEALDATGDFALIVVDPSAVDTWSMRYRMDLRAPSGQRWFLDGVKVLRRGAGHDLWKDTTTLFVTVRDGDANGPVAYRGTLRIAIADFLKQVGTMAVTGDVPEPQRIALLARFGAFFGTSLLDIYGGALATDLIFARDVHPRDPGPHRWGHPDIHDVQTADGVTIRLTRYNGGTKGPIVMAPGFGVSTLSFNVDTVKPNLPQAISERGFDVWLLDYRASPDLPSARSRFSLDDVARKDWFTAVEAVKAFTGAPSVIALGHCVGSMTLLMALLSGLPDVRAAVCSQLTTHPVTTRLTRLKAVLHLAELMDHLGIHTLDTSVQPTIAAKALDLLLRLYPVGSGEDCDSPVCRRIFALYGPSYMHSRLDEATHDAILDMFGVSSVPAFQHITRILRVGHVVDKDGNETYLPNLERLKLPILFLAGAENRLFLPESSRILHDKLAAAFGANLYQRIVIPGYAHMDCFVGQDAAKDVYPPLLDWLDLHA